MKKIISIQLCVTTIIATIAILAFSAATSYGYESSLKDYWKFDDVSADDTFDGSSLNTDRWTPAVSPGGSITINSNQARLNKPATDTSNATITSKCTLSGDFDLSVDFNLITFPALSGGPNTDYISAYFNVRNINGSTANADWSYIGRRNIEDTNKYITLRFVANIANTSTSGKYRLTRSGTDLEGFYWSSGAWVSAGTYANFTTADVNVFLNNSSMYNPSSTVVDYNNFVVSKGETAGNAAGTTKGAIINATQASGKYDKALSFNGTSDYVAVPDSSELHFGASTDFTISAFIKLATTASGSEVIVDKRGGGANGAGFGFVVSSSGLNGYIRDTEGDTASGGTGEALTPGVWYHAALVADRDNGFNLYVNGENKGFTSLAGIGNIDSDKRMGVGWHSPDYSSAWTYFNGLIDDTAFFSRALAADEIRFIGSGSGNSIETFETTYASAGPTSGTWGNTATWRAGVVPTSGYDVHIDSGATVSIDSTSKACNNLYFGDVSGESGTLTLNTGITLTVNGTINDGAGTGTINMDGGTLTVNGSSAIAVDNFNVGRGSGMTGTYSIAAGKSITTTTEKVGVDGTGTITQTGGTNAVTDYMYLGDNNNSHGTYNQSAGAMTVTNRVYIGNNEGSTGAYNLSDAGVLDTAGILVGYYGTGTFTQSGGTNQSQIMDVGSRAAGTYNQSAGTATFSNYIMIGNIAGATGIYNLSGTGELSTPIESVGNYGAGTFTQTGGTNTISGTLYIGRYSGANGIYNLNSGVLTVGTGNIVNGTGTGTLNINGGTLNGAYTALDVDNMNVGTSGTGSFTLGTGKTNTVSNALAIGTNGTYNLSTGGTLNANNVSGSGAINLAGGTLSVSGTYQGPTLNMTSGTLKGSGTITNASFTIGANSILSPGNSPGILTFSGGTETWAGGGSYIWQLYDTNSLAGTGWDLINLTNSAKINVTASTSNKFTIAIQGLSGISPDTPGDPLNFNPNQNYSWKIADGAGGSINSFDATKFAITFSGFTSSLNASNFKLSYTGDLMLSYYGNGTPPSGTTEYMVTNTWGGKTSDSEKSPTNPNDNLMCWAATSANILEWAGWGTTSQTNLTNSDSIFAYYQNHWTDQGGIMEAAWQWWFNGVNPTQGESGWSQVDVAGANFYDPQFEFYDYFTGTDNTVMAMAAIKSYLEAGYGVGLGVYGPGAHAITAWGYKFDQTTGKFLGLYLTDSDDSKSSSNPPDLLQYYNVVELNGKWYLQNFYGSNAWYIGVVEGLELMSKDLIIAALNSLALGYTQDELMELINFYVNSKAGLDADPLSIDTKTWYYWSGLLPGDDGSRAIGSSWQQPDGQYYIKLGSGLGTGPEPLGGDEGTPEPATVVGLLSALFMLASRRVFKRIRS